MRSMDYTLYWCHTCSCLFCKRCLAISLTCTVFCTLYFMPVYMCHCCTVYCGLCIELAYSGQLSIKNRLVWFPNGSSFGATSGCYCSARFSDVLTYDGYLFTSLSLKVFSAIILKLQFPKYHNSPFGAKTF